MSSIGDRFRLDDRVVVVTGASSGLGAATAVAAAQVGAHVVLAARRSSLLERTATKVEAASGRALVVPTDVTQVEDCRQLIQQAMAVFGRIDGLVNGAGVAPPSPPSASHLMTFGPCST